MKHLRNLVAFLAIFMAGFLNPTGALADPITIEASEDNFVWWWEPNTVQNPQGPLLTKLGPSVGDRLARLIYLSFDISSLGLSDPSRSLNDATLSLTVAPKGGDFYANRSVSFNVFGMTDEALDYWSQENLTWNNAPGNNPNSEGVISGSTTLLGQFSFVDDANAVGTEVSISGQNLANVLMSDTNGLVTFIVAKTTRHEYPSFFHSSETGILDISTPRLTVSLAPHTDPEPGSNIFRDTLEDIGPDGTLVITREIAGVTVTISTAGDTEMRAYTYFGSLGVFEGAGKVANAPLHPEFVSGTRFISAPFIDSAQPIIFDFSQPVVGFGLTTVDLLENGAPSGYFVRLEARNASGQVVATQTLTGPQGPTGLDIHWYLSSNKPEITQVILSSNNSGHGPGYGIDDLRLQVAPVTTNLIDATHGAGAGSFEIGTLVHNGQAPNGLGWMHVAPGDGTTIKGWTVGGPGNGVDWLIAPTFRPDSGTRSIDLQHTSSSSIATTIPTVIGQVYELSFGAAAVLGPMYNNNGIVSAGSLLNQPFAADFSDSLSTQTYKPFTFLFTATEPTTTVRFEAVGPGGYGPVIDSVSVREMSPNLIDATYGIGAGSFEFGTLGEGTGWSASGNVFAVSESPSLCCVPSKGWFFANFNGGDTVPNGQLATVLPTTPGARYLLEFDFHM